MIKFEVGKLYAKKSETGEASKTNSKLISKGARLNDSTEAC